MKAKTAIGLLVSAELYRRSRDRAYMMSAVKYSPKFEKRFKNGEDSHMLSEDQAMIMVADGVGGWGDVGVDPGLFSKHLTATV